MRRLFRYLRSTFKALVWMLLLAVAVLAVLAVENSAESICYGETNSGRLENSKRLPYSGGNYSAYWSLGWLIGRTNMHGTPRDIIANAYDSLAEHNPELTFVYGEAGWPWGGRFWPHRTHRNGLSADFVVPVRDAANHSVPFPRSMWTGGFYAVDIGTDGAFDGHRIDFDAMAAHLSALRIEAARLDVGIRRVFFDPALQPLLFATDRGAELATEIPFSKNASWFRHDAHYHVDFDVPCRALT